ncbi:hypothetical protein RJ639_014179 [Escallonia herrerae]|uniref:Polyprotein n=1 Tax=Escallonia herrerae TaxID=1293975 RepID=A0AA89ANG9_9ASTE|nr:hypothetical protein RJ639_014179 [Escallonia herrerae]
MAPNNSTKYDLEKFYGSNDFSLWRMKMRVVLIQQGLLKALKGKQGLPDTMFDDEKEDMLERAHSALLLGEEHGDGLMARGRSTNHAGSRNKGRSRSQSKTRKLKFYHCHKEGHYRKDCPERKGKKKDNSKTADVGVVEDNSDDADVLSITISSLNERWILDTGCSYHMCPNRDWFVTYRSFDGGKVLMGNDVCKVIGICSIQIRMHDGIVRTLTDVKHVPELRKKLISLGMLDSNCCSYRAAGGVMRIMKDALVAIKGLKQNSLYLLHGSTVTGAAAATSSSDIDSDTTKLWHMHLGHMSERGMDMLSKHGYANGVKGYRLWCPDSKSSRFLISRDVTFDESSMLSKKKELIDAGKDHGVREKVELEVRASDSLPIIPTDKDDGSHSIEQNEEPQEQQYNIAKNRPRREIRPPQKYGYADMVAYALSVAESIEVEKPVTYKEAIKCTESADMMTKHILEIKFKHCLGLISIDSI